MMQAGQCSWTWLSFGKHIIHFVRGNTLFVVLVDYIYVDLLVLCVLVMPNLVLEEIKSSRKYVIRCRNP